MKDIMAWKVCLNEHIKKVEPDNEKINSIRTMCDVRLEMLKETKLTDKRASVIASDYYEIIKELLTALLLKNSMKSDNHECLISFFKHNYSKYEYETNIIHQLKDVRNRASYDGVFVKKDYVEKNKFEFEHIIKLLNKLLDE